MPKGVEEAWRLKEMMLSFRRRAGRHELSVENAWLCGLLSDDTESYASLADIVQRMEAGERAEVFGDLLPEPDVDILIGDSGVFLECSCAYPDPKTVVFDARGRAVKWKKGLGLLVLHAYAPDIGSALEAALRKAEEIERRKIAEAGKIQGRRPHVRGA